MSAAVNVSLPVPPSLVRKPFV
ncbi:hypothetical protein [Duganella sp. HH105]